MPLIKATLEIELREIIDQQYGGFVAFPANIAASAAAFANAVNTYVSAIAPPSANLATAKTAFQNALLSINATAGNAITVLSSAFTTYCGILASGMTGFVSVPPPVPVTFVSIPPIGLAGGSSATIAGLMADLIDTYFRTGTATPTGGGSTINWS